MRIISLGLGVQSTALYFLSSMGVIERADHAIFADPGAESVQTYRYLDFLLKWQAENAGIPIMVINERNIYDDIVKHGKNAVGKRFASIPGFTKSKNGTVGMLQRQCTYEYKIAQVHKGIRILQNLPPRARYRPTAIWIGITFDEIQRVKDSVDAWARNVYPFVNLPHKQFFDKPWTRNDCIEFFTNNFLPVPPKSSCVFCPYQSPHRWQAVMNNPEERAKAVAVDNAIRNMSNKGIEAAVYLTRECMPIEDVPFGNSTFDLFDNECEGHCGL